MKGVVFEIEKGKAVVITNDYGFKKIKNQNYEIGSTIELSQKEYRKAKKNYNKMILSFVAVIAIILVCGIFTFNFYSDNYVEYYSLNIDINPSIKVYINKKDEIFKVQAKNEDAMNMDIESIKGMKLEYGIESYLDMCIENNYLYDNSIIDIKINYKNENQDKIEIKDKIETAINKKLVEEEISANYYVENATISSEKKDFYSKEPDNNIKKSKE